MGIVGDHSGGGAHVDPLQRKAAHGQRPQGIGRHLKGNPRGLRRLGLRHATVAGDQDNEGSAHTNEVSSARRL